LHQFLISNFQLLCGCTRTHTDRCR